MEMKVAVPMSHLVSLSLCSFVTQDPNMEAALKHRGVKHRPGSVQSTWDRQTLPGFITLALNKRDWDSSACLG